MVGGVPLSVIFLNSVACLVAESTASCSCRLICPGIQMNVTCVSIGMSVWRVKR